MWLELAYYMTAADLCAWKVAVRAKLEKRREERGRAAAIARGIDPDAGRVSSVLDRFKRTSEK